MQDPCNSESTHITQHAAEVAVLLGDSFGRLADIKADPREASEGLSPASIVGNSAPDTVPAIINLFSRSVCRSVSGVERGQ